MAPPAVPTPEQVTVYLTAHKLETSIEEAVNDAVLKQVKVRACPAVDVSLDLPTLCPSRARAESLSPHC